MTDIRVFFDFENLRGEIEALAGGGSAQQIRNYLDRITQGDNRLVVFSEEVLDELERSGGSVGNAIRGWLEDNVGGKTLRIPERIDLDDYK